MPAQSARGRRVDEVVQLVGDDGVVLGRRLGRPVLENWTETGSIVQRDGREVPVVVSACTLSGPCNDVNGAAFLLRSVVHDRSLDRSQPEFPANIRHPLPPPPPPTT